MGPHVRVRHLRGRVGGAKCRGGCVDPNFEIHTSYHNDFSCNKNAGEWREYGYQIQEEKATRI